MRKSLLALLAFGLILPLLAFENILPGDSTFESGDGYFNHYWMDKPNAMYWETAEGPTGACLRVELPGGESEKSIAGEKVMMQANTLFTFRMKVKLDPGICARIAFVHSGWQDTMFYPVGEFNEWGECVIEHTPKFSEPYTVLLELSNNGSEVGGAYVDDVELFQGSVKAAAAEAAAARGNLFTGNCSYEGGDGYFSKLWCNQGSTLQLVDGADAPDGEMYATTFVDAGDCHSYFGDGMYLEKDRQYVFSCWIKADKPTNCQLITVNTRWADTRFNNFHVTDQWQRVEVPFTVGLNEDYWLILELTNRKNETEGRLISFDAIQLEYGSKAGPFHRESKLYTSAKIHSEYNGVFFREDAPVLELQAKDFRSDIPGEPSYTVTVTDYAQNKVFELSEKAVLNGRSFRKEIPLPVDKYGLFTARAKWMDEEGNEVDNQTVTFTIVQHPRPDDPEVEPYMGVNSGVPAGVERIGVRWVEHDMWWRTLMPTPDTIDYEGVLAGMRTLKARGFKVKFSLVHLPGSPNWVHRPEEAAEAKAWGIPESQGFFGTDEALEKLSVAFEELIRRAGDNIDLLEIGGEDELISGSEPYYRKKYPKNIGPHGHVYGPVCRDLAKITTVYLQAAHRANPELLIAAGRPSGGSAQVADFPFSREVLSQVEGDFQFFPMDCYSFKMRYLDPTNMPNIGSPNREYQSVFRNANEMTHTYLQGQKPYVAEYGFAIDNRLAPDHPLQQEETNRMISAVLTARLLGSPYFFWFNTQGCVESKVFDYGMWHDDIPMLLIPAMSQVCQVVEGVRQYDSRLGTEESNLKLGVFGQKDRAFLAFWTDQIDNPVHIDVPAGARCVDFVGNEEDIPANGLFTAGILAKYLVLEGPDAYEQLHSALESAEDCANSLFCHLELKAGNRGTLAVENVDPKSKSAAQVAISFDGIEVKSDSKKSGKGFPWKISVDVPDGAQELTAVLTDEKGRTSPVVIPLPIERLTMGESVFSDFGDKRVDIIPPDPWIRWDGRADLGGQIRVEVTDDELIIYADVQDDLHFNDKAGTDLWNGDCIQVAVIPNVSVYADTKAREYAPKVDVELGLALTNNGSDLFWFRGEYPEELSAGKDYEVTRDDANGVTHYRVALSRNALHLDKPGQYFRMACVVMDDDEGSGASYWYQSSPGITGAKNTNLFKLYQLP